MITEYNNFIKQPEIAQNGTKKRKGKNTWEKVFHCTISKYYVEFGNNNNNEKFQILKAFSGYQTGESFCWSGIFISWEMIVILKMGNKLWN